MNFVGIEFELKFRATPGLQVAIREAFPGAEQKFDMQTTYYDTPDGALAEQFCTLRRRMENDVSVCTLKTPAGALGRGEFELQGELTADTVKELCKLAGKEELVAALAKGIVPVCGASFTRLAKTLTPEGCTVELALDSGVLTGGGKAAALCEVEVELKEGSREAAAAFARKLATDFGLMPETKSKFRRALDLAKGGNDGTT